MHHRTCALLLGLLALALPAFAEDTEEKWYDRVDLLGDARLRYEGFRQDDNFNDDRRDRFRIRLRVGIEIAITDALKVGIQARNGDPDDPVSNNTSFDGAFQFKDFNLAQGYVDFRAASWLDVIGGKFEAGKRWTVSDFQWDDDVTVEGAMENVHLASDATRYAGMELVAYQFLLEESGSGDDAFVFGGQARANFDLTENDALGVGVGFDYWDNPQAVVVLTLDGSLMGNRVTTLLDADGQLVSDFEIVNLFAEWKHTRSERWPIKVNLFYYQNLGADGIGEDHDTGFFGRVQYGDYKTKGQVALRYSYYYSEPDALFYVFTQSDTSRASDVKGHRFDVRIGFIARSYFNLTWYHTEAAYAKDEPLDRWQVDYIVRF